MVRERMNMMLMKFGLLLFARYWLSRVSIGQCVKLARCLLSSATTVIRDEQK